MGGKNPVPSLTSGVGRASDQVVGVPPGKNLQGVPSGKNPGVGVPSGKNPSPVPRTMEESRQLADLATMAMTRIERIWQGGGQRRPLQRPAPCLRCSGHALCRWRRRR